MTASRPRPRQLALVLGGGGALGAFEAGLYEALDAAGFQADRLAGSSIGAFNAALIAGNPPERRIERLRTFWDRVSSRLLLEPLATDATSRKLFNEWSAALIANAAEEMSSV